MKKQIAVFSSALVVSSFTVTVGAMASGRSLTIASPVASPTAPVFEPSWLDDASNWNQAGAALPSAPPQEGSNLPYCTESSAWREAALPEDEAVESAGWKIYGAAQVFGSTTVVTAMANADGMCRPMDYQAFVFQDGQFVGTLSPNAMAARAEASLARYDLYGEGEILATFNRYTTNDAFCCPSGESLVFYRIEPQGEASILIPELPASTTPKS
jgi:LppP/LprE lipoprotein